MRYFRHVLQHNFITSNTDESIGHAHIPSEGQFNGMQGEVHVQGGGATSIDSLNMYGCDGWLIPVEDPDTVDLIDDIWDRFVDKDFAIATGSFDLDTNSTDTISFDEPGVGSPDRLAGIRPLEEDKRWYRRRKMLSFQQNPRGFVTGTPDVYVAGDVFKVRSRRRMSPDVMSVAILGFGSIASTSTTATHASSLTENEWIQLKYMEVVLEQAWMDLMGLTEAGAETPWDEATDLIAEILEPLVIEDTAAALAGNNFNVWAKTTWDLSVPGRRDMSKALTAAS